MPQIRILDDVVVNQIAAGEVVERPASVVKELVENAIDALATEIRVSVVNGGKSHIEVIDNGCGMSAEDAALAIQRFGTSKIRSAEDLVSIATLGFRGEALPSIASVSRFRLTTSEKGATQGTHIFIEGGIHRATEPTAAPVGTRIEVRDLFFNVPARKKFLRTENTEAGLVRSLLTDFALAYPSIRFSLYSDTTQVLNFPPVENFAARVQQVRLAGQDPVVLNEDFVTSELQLRVQGVICRPIEAVSSPAKLRLLVNGRSVRDKLLLKAVREGYGAYMRPGKYPAGVLSLQLPAAEVDVNVHPQKTEVRFRSSSEVFRAVLISVSRGLSRNASVGADEQEQHVTTFAAETRPQYQPLSFSAAQRSPVQAPTEVRFHSGFQENDGEVSLPHTRMQQTQLDVLALRDMRYVGQIFSLYLLFEGEIEGKNYFAVVDMHAAHERVMFFRLKQQQIAKQIELQQTLLPLVIPVGLDDWETANEALSALQELGFDVRTTEAGTFELHAFPALFADLPLGEIVRDLLAECESSSLGRQLETYSDHILARVACHASVRSGRKLKQEEVASLVETLGQAESSALCPHGRPVVKYFSEYQMEQFFGRVV